MNAKTDQLRIAAGVAWGASAIYALINGLSSGSGALGTVIALGMTFILAMIVVGHFTGNIKTAHVFLKTYAIIVTAALGIMMLALLVASDAIGSSYLANEIKKYILFIIIGMAMWIAAYFSMVSNLGSIRKGEPRGGKCWMPVIFTIIQSLSFIIVVSRLAGLEKDMNGGLKKIGDLKISINVFSIAPVIISAIIGLALAITNALYQKACEEAGVLGMASPAGTGYERQYGASYQQGGQSPYGAYLYGQQQYGAPYQQGGQNPYGAPYQQGSQQGGYNPNGKQ